VNLKLVIPVIDSTLPEGPDCFSGDGLVVCQH
jgi:hypothetical protein